MISEKEISELLQKEFSYIYCHNCEGNTDDYPDRCEDCHRKSMNWTVNPDVCNQLAKKIIEE